MLQVCELIREGKSKRIYATNDPSLAVVYYKDEAMAFHGLKRGRIWGKGEVNNAVCRTIFTLLEKNGVATHFVRQLDSRQSLIRRVEMVPMEVKVRNRVAGSLTRRIGLPEGTLLHMPVVEFLLKNEALDNPLLNISHIQALQLANRAEIDEMTATALKVNHILQEYMREIGVELIDFQLEFGRMDGKLLVADDISPDTARFWDARTHEPMDIDRFRRDLGGTEQAYQELLARMMGAENPNGEETR